MNLHDRLVAGGVKPQLQKLDNEASRRLQQCINNKGIQLQLVPPHSHHANATERAIHTFKNHFIATLCGTDPLFPMNLWDQLVLQAELTLNLLRPARMIHVCPRTPTCMVNSTTMQHRLQSFSNHLLSELPGHRMVWTGGMSDLHSNITDATESMSPPPMPLAPATLWNSFLSTQRCPNFPQPMQQHMSSVISSMH